LEERFLEPEGWRWHEFTRDGRRLRFGTVSPQNTIPAAVVVALPGLNEFGEKYFETARQCLDMNLSFWVLDWMGQGGSGRYLKNPLKRHAGDFADDIADVHYFLNEYVKPAAVHPDRGRIPRVMLGHSMGGNIGLRVLSQHPDMFECAAFSAPMLGIYALRRWPVWAAMLASGFLNIVVGKKFTSPDGRFSERQNQNFANNPLTSDPARFALTYGWMQRNTVLKICDVTYGWVYQALKSCKVLDKTPSPLRDINKPCLFALAGNETIVDNDAARRLIAQIPNAQIIELEGAQHEILMEANRYRDRFFAAFKDLITKNILEKPETLKPF
jgi:lysophospholipase